MSRLICFVIGYAFGLFQTGYIIGRIKGFDIRTKGSGNAGTTNAIRTMGWKWGLVTFFCDAIKTILAILVVRLIYHDSSMLMLLCTYAGAGAIVGHDYPVYLKFHGGKGIAASAGMVIAFGDWRLIALGLACFFIPAILTKYVSLGSLCLYADFFISITVFGALGTFGLSFANQVEMDVVFFLLMILAYYQHRKNIHRLLTGTESKIGLHNKKQ